MDSSASTGGSILQLTAVLPFLGAIVAALLGWFGALSTRTAPQQMALNDAFRTLMDELQNERAQHIVRISELESEVIRQRGEIAQHLQIAASLQHQVDRYREKLDRYE